MNHEQFYHVNPPAIHITEAVKHIARRGGPVVQDI